MRPLRRGPSRLSDRRGLGRQAVVVVLVAIAGTMLGAVVAAKAMFVSTHDLKALFVILVGAGTVAVLAALHLGEEVDRASHALGDVTRGIGVDDAGRSTVASSAPEELPSGSLTSSTRWVSNNDEAHARERHVERIAARTHRLGVARPAHPTGGHPGHGRVPERRGRGRPRDGRSGTSLRSSARPTASPGWSTTCLSSVASRPTRCASASSRSPWPSSSLTPWPTARWRPSAKVSGCGDTCSTMPASLTSPSPR